MTDRYPGRVAVLCGRGNNGGDGRVCARVLRERGREVVLVEALGDFGEPDVIVDALLGIGLDEAPREDVARMIERINASGKPVVAVDVPSGVNASTGEVPGAAVRAETTVTFGAAKVGLAVAPGRFHAGLVHVAPIGLEPVAFEHRLVQASALDDVPRKTAESNKYRAGSVLVVGGSPGKTGAPALAALAAFRADAGYVTVAAPESALAAIEARVLEAVKWPLPEDTAGPVASAFRRLGARGRRAGGRGRARPGPRPQRRHPRPRASPPRADPRSGGARRRRALVARAVRARRRDGDDAALRASSRACSRPTPTRSTRTGSSRCAARPRGSVRP